MFIYFNLYWTLSFPLYIDIRVCIFVFFLPPPKYAYILLVCKYNYIYWGRAHITICIVCMCKSNTMHEVDFCHEDVLRPTYTTMPTAIYSIKYRVEEEVMGKLYRQRIFFSLVILTTNKKKIPVVKANSWRQFNGGKTLIYRFHRWWYI